VMSSALRAAEVPFELHVLPKGGHGYGMRAGHRAAETWPKLCEEWLKVTVLK
jgi:acetyl esterase/lipase